MSSTKITSSEFIENMCYFHFQMQVCTPIVMCGSNENHFGQCFPIKFPNVAAFTLYVYVPSYETNMAHMKTILGNVCC